MYLVLQPKKHRRKNNFYFASVHCRKLIGFWHFFVCSYIPKNSWDWKNLLNSPVYLIVTPALFQLRNTNLCFRTWSRKRGTRRERVTSSPSALSVGIWWTQKSWSDECSDQHLVKMSSNARLGNAMRYFFMKSQVHLRNEGLAGTQVQEELSTVTLNYSQSLSIPP